MSLLLLPDFEQNQNVSTYFSTLFRIKFYENSFSISQVVACRQKDAGTKLS